MKKKIITSIALVIFLISCGEEKKQEIDGEVPEAVLVKEIEQMDAKTLKIEEIKTAIDASSEKLDVLLDSI